LAFRKFDFSILLILLILAVVGVSASVQVVPDWQQVNNSGFGDPQVSEVSALAVFNGHLYAGTYNPIDPGPQLDGTQILRSSDGETWSPVTERGFGSDHDTAPPAILDLTLFKGYLYAGTGRGDAAQIWRSLNGVNWGRVVNAGFGDPDTVDFTTLAVYNQALYVGATNQVSGAQIWRTLIGDGNLNNWTQVAPTVPMTDTASVSDLAIFDDVYDTGLYAAVSYAADLPAQIWRSYGGVWETVLSDGFGDSKTTATGGMAVFGGDLYVGAGNKDSGAQLWRSSDGDNWALATPAFGDANNEKVEQVFVFKNKLYIGVANSGSGIEIWRTSDPSNSSLWEQVNPDGFGDINNTTTNGSSATADFLDQFYVGTSNVVDGGELWRMQQPYGVDLSPDDSLSGPAGEQVIYTLIVTNSGSMVDSFDLLPSGNNWTTTLSSQLVTLGAGGSQALTVTVLIPPAAPALASDQVSIRATSQQDSSKQDTAVLTTVSTGHSTRNYLPIVISDTAQ
jgi:hypothetical protein